jgi:drug/metabolite transporter (DMT)-like permease
MHEPLTDRARGGGLPTPTAGGVPRPTARDWALLGLLAAIWGSAFLFIRLGVEQVPPATLTAGRIGIGAGALLAFARWRGLRLPALGREWGGFLALGVVGNALPFVLISWGQERVPSGLAGLLMAVMPLTTLVLAHRFVPGERMTARRAAGFGLGFGGILVLVGPDVLLELGGGASDLVREAAVLGGALCYAANSVLARRLGGPEPLVTSAGVMLAASALMLPVALGWDRPWEVEADAVAWGSVVWLGVVATGVATLVFFQLIASAGPTFFSLINYLIPCIALGLGAAALGEPIERNALAALALVLGGIALAQTRR